MFAQIHNPALPVVHLRKKKTGPSHNQYIQIRPQLPNLASAELTLLPLLMPLAFYLPAPSAWAPEQSNYAL